MQKIRKGDEVIVLAGKDKSRRGAVLERVGEDRVIVEGVNMCKVHQRPNPYTGVEGGIVEEAKPIHISNVAIYNTATNKRDRILIKEIDGKKHRVYRSTGEVIGVKG